MINWTEFNNTVEEREQLEENMYLVLTKSYAIHYMQYDAIDNNFSLGVEDGVIVIHASYVTHYAEINLPVNHEFNIKEG